LKQTNTHYLPTELYSAQQARELDRIAIEEHGVGGYTLMRRAGRGMWQRILAVYPSVSAITVFCGGGNNGGDGYVVATVAKAAGMDVQVISVADTAKLSGAALTAFEQAKDAGINVDYFSDGIEICGELIVDALLGTGLNKDVSGKYLAAIERINTVGLPVASADIPSGLCANTGAILGCAVQANLTATFIGVKQGLLTGNGPACSGELGYDDLALPQQVFDAVTSTVKRLPENLFEQWLPARNKATHKGSNGHVLIIGGDKGFAGAVAMAAEAALRVGAGLVSVATRPEHVAVIVARTPEVMAHGVGSGQELASLVELADVIVVGPGLGQSAWSEQLLQQVAAATVPLVMDADALNLLAAKRVIRERRRNNWILTPHPGEAARLLQTTTEAIQIDRFAAVTELQKTYGGIAVLKGSGTLVKGEHQNIHLCTAGNPGMGTGGMGDVLSGVLGGLLAQGLSVDEASQCGVLLHSTAADVAAKNGERGLLATDVINELRALVNP
jgi:NAD(P)H-hydrate epimerase